MLAFLLTLVASAAALKPQMYHPAVDEAKLGEIRSKLSFRNTSPYVMSVSSGAPVSNSEAQSSLNADLLRHQFFMDLMTHQTRERTCTRPVHKKGAGAFGYIEITNDISHICKASFLSEVGKRTPVAVRFSPGSPEKGGSDVMRDIRGFGIKFYTEEGNFDLPAINTPVFPTMNPLYYVKLIHAIRKRSALYVHNPMTLWDFILEHPKALHSFMYMFSDHGIPADYRHMAGYGVISYQVSNKDGKRSFLRFIVEPNLGVKPLQPAEAQKINVADPDFHTRNLYDAINKGEFPSWTFSVQIVTEEDVKRLGYSAIFDATRVLNKSEFPLHEVGQIVLDKNPTNPFAEFENIAINPANLVDGIQGGPDPLFQARQYAYTSAQQYRLGSNIERIPVNCPYMVPGHKCQTSPPFIPQQSSGLLKIGLLEDKDNFDQVTEFYNGLTIEERDRLVENIVLALSPASESVQEGMVKLFTTVHSELACMVSQGLNNAKN